jgi:hypothetical protein
VSNPNRKSIPQVIYKFPTRLKEFPKEKSQKHHGQTKSAQAIFNSDLRAFLEKSTLASSNYYSTKEAPNRPGLGFLLSLQIWPNLTLFKCI